MTLIISKIFSMKELIDIINKLHTINEQIVEKDNLINDMSIIVDLVSQLVVDADFIRSEIYLDLRAKYLLKVEEKLKSMEQARVTIEPENLTTTKTKKDDQGKPVKHFTKEEVQGPIRTDIFAAPSARRTFTRKKVKKDDSEKNDAEPTKKEKYISFNDNNEIYYIHIIDNVDQYDIYNQQMSLVGHMKGPIITLICNDETLESKNIDLQTVFSTDKEYLFGSYILNSA